MSIASGSAAGGHGVPGRPSRDPPAPPAGLGARGRAGPTSAHAKAPTAPAAGGYVGLVTRTLAFALDAAIINVAAIVATALVTLCLSVISVPDAVETAVGAAGAVLYLVWIVAYFVTFWSTTGQTPGSRVLRIRVRPYEGDRLPPGRALLRFVGLTLAALPLMAGYLMILVDNRRRGLQDVLARTVVVEDRPTPGGDER